MSRFLLTQAPRHLPSWLIFDVRQKHMNTQAGESAISGIRKIVYISLSWCVALLMIAPVGFGVRLFPVPIGIMLSIPFLCVGATIAGTALYLGWGYFGVVTAYACIAKHRKAFRRAFCVLAASLILNVACYYGVNALGRGWHEGISLYRKNVTEPNKALEPTPGPVTSRAFARLAPSTSMAHL
jgi:hypothetical protein